MAASRFRFGEYLLDVGERRLRRGDEPVEVSARYLDALALLVGEQGKLVTKDRFLDEVWRGVPVTEEALSQCISTLRRQLGDDAARPRFIETVPKHGYRFIGAVERLDGEAAAAPRDDSRASRSTHPLLIIAAGVAGGGFAGFLGGLFYGFAGASQPLQPGMGAASVLLVLLSLTMLVGLVGAAGVAGGIALSDRWARRPWQWSIAGGALGGLVIGAIVKLVGLDAFNLLLGRAPGDITGAPEGLTLGAAVGFGVWLSERGRNALSLRRCVAAAAAAGGAVGLVAPLLGGRLMGGSLDLVARQFPGSRLRLDQIGALIGEERFGLTSQMVTGALEGALFAGCVVGAMIVARREFAAD